MLVAMEVVRFVLDDDNWDSDREGADAEFRPIDIPMFRPAAEQVARIAADAPPPRQSRSARRGARRYNPNRHLEREDYVSARASSPSSEEAGPPMDHPLVVEEQRAIGPPPARGVEPRVAQRQGPVHMRLGESYSGDYGQCQSTPRLIPPPFTALIAGSQATARGSACDRKCGTIAVIAVAMERT